MPNKVVAPIKSSLASDPDMLDLVEMFVEDAEGKAQNFERLLEGQEWEEIKRAAHQLKGSSGGYGFECLTPLARDLEAAMNESRTEGVQELIEELNANLRAIVV